MESSPIRDPRILEALEACRPGSEDIRDPVMEPLARQLGVFPELAALYERLQQTDRAIAEVFREVPVPAGLAARVLTQMAAAPRRWKNCYPCRRRGPRLPSRAMARVEPSR